MKKVCYNICMLLAAMLVVTNVYSCTTTTVQDQQGKVTVCVVCPGTVVCV